MCFFWAWLESHRNTSSPWSHKDTRHLKPASVLPKHNLPGRKDLSLHKSYRLNVLSALTRLIRTDFENLPLFPTEGCWTKHNIIPLWLNILLLKPRENLLTFSQVHGNLRGAGKPEPSSQGAVCLRPVPSHILHPNVVKTTRRHSGVSSGFNFLWKFPDSKRFRPD